MSRAGQLLIRLDERDFRAALDRAQAIAESAQATLASLEAQIRPAADSRSARPRPISTPRPRKRRSPSEDADRYRDLAQTSSARGRMPSGRRPPTGKRKRRPRRPRPRSPPRSSRLTVLRRGDRRCASADVAQAEADLETAELNLGYTEIRSPIDGYVGNRAAQVGAYVAGGAYLLTIIPAHGLWVDANFKEDQLAHMRPGQPATVVADVLPGHVFHGHVAEPGARRPAPIFSVIPPENATGNFTKIVQRVPVRIALDDDDARCSARLRPGLSTTVSVDTRPSTGGAGSDHDARPPPPSWLRSLLPFVVMCVGMFMALLDIQIVASSLQDIGGGLSAAQDQISWVQTAYLIAEIIMIPLSGWLTRVFSTRWLFTASAAGFTVASMLCGLAWNIESMIVFRALQGLLGASMIPTVFTSSFHYLPGSAPRLFGRGGRHDRLDRADARAGDRRLDHRHAELALAVLCQPRARHRDHDPGRRCW